MESCDDRFRSHPIHGACASRPGQPKEVVRQTAGRGGQGAEGRVGAIKQCGSGAVGEGVSSRDVPRLVDDCVQLQRLYAFDRSHSSRQIHLVGEKQDGHALLDLCEHNGARRG